MKKLSNKSKGFTLIEVVLVLAIGALIILMAVLAFQGAQASRRNTARTNLANQIKAAVEQYAADNSNNFPANGYVTGTMATNSAWKDPKGGAITSASSTSSNLGAVGIQYSLGSACSGGNIVAGASSNTYAVQYYQENGVLGCTDSTK